MVPLKRGESLQQIMRFFNSLSRLIALQIRELLYNWIDEWLTAVSVYGPRDESVSTEIPKEHHRVHPFIRLELAANNGKIFVKPKREIVLWTLDKAVKNIVNVSCHIPRVEKMFLQGTRNNYFSPFFHSISFDF